MNQKKLANLSAGSKPWWRRTLPWGLTASLVLGATPLLFSPQSQGPMLGIVVILTGTVLTLLVDPLLRLDDLTGRANETLAEISDTVAMLDAPLSLQLFVSQIREDWRHIETAGGLPFALLEAYARDSSARIHSIAAGRVSVRASDPNNFRSAPLHMFRQLRMVHAVNIDYWNQPNGRQYLARQRDAIAAGALRVERLMVIGLEEIDTQNARDAVMRQIIVGISVTIVKREEVPQSLRKYLTDFGIVTDVRAAKFLAMPTGDDLESFWYDTSEVAEYEHGFNALRGYGNDVGEIYPEIGQIKKSMPDPSTPDTA